MKIVKNNEQSEKGNIGFHKELEHKENAIFVKVSDETRAIIDKYKELGTTISNLVKDAIKMYDDYNSMSPETHAIIDTHKEEEETLLSFLEHAIKYYGEQKA